MITAIRQFRPEKNDFYLFFFFCRLTVENIRRTAVAKYYSTIADVYIGEVTNEKSGTGVWEGGGAGWCVRVGNGV